MLFAYCMACFEALLGFFYVEKKSVAIAKSFFDTQPVYQQSGATALNTVEMHKDRQFPCTKTGICLWSKCSLLSFARWCSQLFPWTFLTAALHLPIPCFFRQVV